MCGIFGIYSVIKNKNIGYEMINGLKLLQHRGHDGYGLVYYSNAYHLIKKLGKIHINNINIESKCCIGHTRYSTSGYTINEGILKKTELQPLKGMLGSKEFYLIHNGTIPFVKGHDTSFLRNLIQSLHKKNIEQILIYIMNNIPAAYCLMILFDKKLYVLRDRYGIRPLCIGKYKKNYYVSSESYALNTIPFLRDVDPGEILKIDDNGITSIYTHPKSQLSLCTFEILYFLNECNITDGYDISYIRKQLAYTLAKKEQLVSKKYIVVGIPLTGILLGKAYADYLNLEYIQSITKNPAISRTFIKKTNEERKGACMKKFIYNKQELKGRNIIIVDDTIVRGNVITAIIKNLRSIGVCEIHVRIPSPPVIDRCFLGISIQSKKELIMTNRTIEQVKTTIGADSLRFLTLDDIAPFIPQKSYNHCFSGYINKKILYNCHFV